MYPKDKQDMHQQPKLINKPILRSFHLCDHVYVDPSTGKHSILGSFSRIAVGKLPILYPKMFWFISLSDVDQGNHTLSFYLNPLGSKPHLVGSREFCSRGPTFLINSITQFEDLRFEQGGEHSITVEIDGKVVHVDELDVEVLQPSQ